VNIFWPGIIIGSLLVIVCVFAYIKRDALSGIVGEGTAHLIGKKAAEKAEASHEQRVANLMLPLFGGMAMGVAILIFSVTGVMR
jgi:hypothetical protein